MTITTIDVNIDIQNCGGLEYLNAIPDNPANYVNLLSEQNNIKQKIRRLVKTVNFFPACDFCDGRPYDPSSKLGYDGKGMIPMGVQVSSPLPYKAYN